MRLIILFFVGLFFVGGVALAAPISIGTAEFNLATADIKNNTITALVTANIGGKMQIAGLGDDGTLYRLSRSFSSILIEPTVGEIIQPNNKKLNITFGKPIQGVPLEYMGETSGFQQMMVKNGSQVATYVLPETEVFIAGTAQEIYLSPVDGFIEVAVVTLDTHNKTALSLFFVIDNYLTRVAVIPKERGDGLMDFVGIDNSKSPPALIVLNDASQSAYLTFYSINKTNINVLGNFYGFSNFITNSSIRPLTLSVNFDDVDGNEIVSFRNDLKRQQTLSAPVASGITVLKNDKNIVTSLGMILSDNTVAIMFRNDTP